MDFDRLFNASFTAAVILGFLVWVSVIVLAWVVILKVF